MHCTKKIVSAYLQVDSASAERVGQGEVGGVTRRVLCTLQLLNLFGCKRVMVGTRWVNSCPGCMNRLRKCYSHLLGGSFLARKASWVLNGCLPTKNADYCVLVNEWAWLRSQE